MTVYAYLSQARLTGALVPPLADDMRGAVNKNRLVWYPSATSQRTRQYYMMM
jgi:hypothetical protein